MIAEAQQGDTFSVLLLAIIAITMWSIYALLLIKSWVDRKRRK